MDRRSLLRLGFSAGTLGLSGWLLRGCQADPNAPHILGLKSAIPGQVLKAFRRQNEVSNQLVYESRDRLAEIFNQLQDWKRREQNLMPPEQPWLNLRLPYQAPPTAPPTAQLTTLGDYWLPVAIAQGLIQPIAPEKLTNWPKLDDRWQQLVRRNRKGELDPQGSVWGAPYRWGATVIAYRRDLFAQHGLKPPIDWADLCQPGLKGRISLLDSPRETIGLALKLLGKSYGEPNLEAVSELASTMQKLHEQAKFYSSDAYLQPLLLGHTWLAVGWSADLLPQVRNQPELEIVVPASGTALAADVWVRPSSAIDNQLFNQWIDFCWAETIAPQLATLSRSGSPLTQRRIASSTGEKNPLLQLPDSIWEKSETLAPQSPMLAAQYEALWAKTRLV
jgi:putative spermidine/putrescine transport system substrate-binding protein